MCFDDGEKVIESWDYFWRTYGLEAVMPVFSRPKDELELLCSTNNHCTSAVLAFIITSVVMIKHLSIHFMHGSIMTRE